jgi:hypothetical protein
LTLEYSGYCFEEGWNQILVADVAVRCLAKTELSNLKFMIMMVMLVELHGLHTAKDIIWGMRMKKKQEPKQ